MSISELDQSGLDSGGSFRTENELEGNNDCMFEELERFAMVLEVALNSIPETEEIPRKTMTSRAYQADPMKTTHKGPT